MRSQARAAVSSRTPRSCGPWPTPPGWPCWSTSERRAGHGDGGAGSWACRECDSYHLRARGPGGTGGSRTRAGDGRERLWRVTAGRYEVSGVATGPEGRGRCTRCWSRCWPGMTPGSASTWPGSEPSRGVAGRAFFMDSTLQVTAAELTALSGRGGTDRPYRNDRRGGLPPGTRRFPDRPRPPRLAAHSPSPSGRRPRPPRAPLAAITPRPGDVSRARAPEPDNSPGIAHVAREMSGLPLPCD